MQQEYKKKLVASLNPKKNILETLTKGRDLKTNCYSLRLGQDNGERLTKENKLLNLEELHMPHVFQISTYTEMQSVEDAVRM